MRPTEIVKIVQGVNQSKIGRIGKSATHWLRNQSAQEFINALAALRNRNPTELVQVILVVPMRDIRALSEQGVGASNFGLTSYLDIYDRPQFCGVVSYFGLT